MAGVATSRGAVKLYSRPTTPQYIPGPLPGAPLPAAGMGWFVAAEQLSSSETDYNCLSPGSTPVGPR